MRYFVHFGIAACLICNALLSASTHPLPAGQNRQVGPATSSSPSQLAQTNGHEPASTLSAGVTEGELAKVCSKKNPPPCATPPHVVSSPGPEYSPEARAAQYQGTCKLSLIVEPDGRTSHITVLDRLGMGLSEKAIEAVKQWKFKPGMRDGKPVPVQITVEVTFRISEGIPPDNRPIPKR